MPSTPRVRFAVLAVLGGALAFALALRWLPAARVGDSYVPMEFDSFYHARRILDTIREPSAFYEFDRLNYAPEGTWISWPWAYDYVLARLTSAAMAMTGIRDAMRILVLVPPAWVFVNAALTLAVGAAAGLGPAMQVLLMLSFALSPLTQLLHGAGRIDHHYLEYTFVQATLLGLLAWRNRPASATRAAALGAMLGLSQGVQNGLFILQLPVLAVLALRWWRGGRPLERAPAFAFAGALLATTLALLLPSAPFREGLYDFTLLSWFHLHVAAATAVAAAALALMPPRRSTLLGGLVVAALVALPALGQGAAGLRFVGASLHDYQRVGELESVLGLGSAGGFTAWESTTLYSALVWLGPAVLAWGVVRLARPRDERDTALAVFTLFGLLLMHLQFRMHYFGSFTLALPVLLVIEDGTRQLGATQRRTATAIAAIALAAAFLPCRGQLLALPATGLSPLYASLRGLYLTMGELCARDPGVMLADRSVGSFIRFHSDCAVMASNMLIDDEQARRVERLERLTDGSLAELRRSAPWVKYVFLLRADTDWGHPTEAERAANGRGLRQELLGDEVPPGVLVVQEASMKENKATVAFARLLDIRAAARDR